jgi:exodeoxyribonuclease V beta subunit
LLLLKAIAEPGNVRALRTALVTETLGLDAHELLALDQDEVAWDRWSDRFRRWHERWFQYGFVQMMHQLLSDCSLPSRLLGLRDGERRMTNLMQLIELLHTRASDHHLGPRGVLHYLWEQLNERLVASDSEQVRLESDADAVVLTTIHKSKGLEYPIVLCPTLFNPTAVFGGDAEWPRFHDEQHSHRLTLDLGGPELKEHAALMQEEALAENLRLLYVALTRAKHRCIVFWGAFFKFQTSALAYLLHGPVATGDDEDTEAGPGAEKLDDEALLRRLLELDPSAEQIGVHAVERDAKDLSRPQQIQGNRQLTCLRSERVRQIWERTASFSSLTAGAAHRLDPLDGRDYDPQQASVERPPRTSEVLTTLATFPGGTTTGNFFHSVLEHCDFRGTDFDAAVRRALVEHGPPEGLSAEQSNQLVLSALGEMTRARFGKNLSLADIAPAERLNEMEFYLPAPRLRDHRAITCERLAAAFRDHPSPAVPNSYADSLLGLDFAPLSGFLKGFIDLVFEHRGRWYVVDYKTNNLGPNYSDYAAAELRAPMASSHYILQYHLYCLAVHRYLSLRHPNYSYEQDFGGSYYLFLRGMHPEHSPKTGVFFEKPPLGRILALAELFPAQNPSRQPERTHAECCK